MKRSYFVAAVLVAVVFAVGVLAVPEAQALAHGLLDPAGVAAGVLLAIPPVVVPVTSKTIRALQAKKAKDLEAMRALSDAAEGALSAEDQAKYDALKASIESLNAAIAREAELVAEEAQLGSLEVPSNARVAVHERAEDDPTRGFRTAGEFFQAVRQMPGPQNGYALNGQLHIGAAAPSTFGSEGVGSDGGFAVPPQFSMAIYTHSLEQNSLLPLTDNDDVTGNSMVYPKDETTPWGTDGIRAYWQSEATAANLTKPKLSTTTLRLQKLMALVPLTDELIADGVALGGYITKKVGDSIRWKMNEAILFGLGNGTPQGAFQGNAAIVQAKDGGQATLTLSALNLANMISRLPEGSYGSAIWMVNNNVLPALFTLTLSNYPIYLPAGGSQGGIQGNPYGTVLGRPLMVTQHAKSFTSQGDVLLMDPTYYRTITKAGGVQTATSIHIYFDADATAFRTTFRVDGQPKIVNPINPANGATTLSPFVQLAAR
jgi:HK97 family phage major capsid protein